MLTIKENRSLNLAFMFNHAILFPISQAKTFFYNSTKNNDLIIFTVVAQAQQNGKQVSGIALSPPSLVLPTTTSVIFQLFKATLQDKKLKRENALCGNM